MKNKPTKSSALAAGLAFVLSFAGCRSAEPEDPVSAYRSFYEAAAAGDWDGMFERLDAQSQECLAKAAERLARQLDLREPALPFYLRQMRVERIAPLREVRLLEQKQDKAVLEFRAGPCNKPETCSVRRVEMTRAPRGWRVQARFLQPLMQNLGVTECGI